MNINLILVRHGESLANVDHSVYYKTPDNQIPLSARGVQQALDVGLELSNISERGSLKIIHSPWTRAKETAQHIASVVGCTDVIEDPIIFEISLMHSFLDMQTEVHFLAPEKTEYGFFWYKEGTSESYADVYQRARIFVQDLKLNKYDFYNEENVVIVSHGVFINMIIAALNNHSVEEILKLRWIENCGISYQSLSI